MFKFNSRHSRHIGVLLILCCIFVGGVGFADDTCIFAVTANDVPPNIVLLLDNGAAMEQIAWHANYDNSVDYTPAVGVPKDIVEYGVNTGSDGDINDASGNGFFNDNGYAIRISGGKYYLVDIPSDLDPANYTHSLMADGDGRSNVWTLNGRTVTLPAVPSASVDADGIKDNAAQFRYSKNYINWIFYGSYAGDGSDLPDKSRFYHAKKAIMTVAKLTANQAKIGIYNFTSNADGASNVQPLGLVVNEPVVSPAQNNTLNSNFVNNVNNMGTVTYSPIAEGLARVGGYYASSSSHVVGEYCQKNFVIVVSPGVSSEDQAAASQSSPASLSDSDGDNGDGGIGEGNVKADSTTYTIPINLNGSTYLDDVAHYLYTNDIVGYQDGFQNVYTYTIGFMGDQIGNLFLINTSNNGNGNVNLYDTTDLEYGRYHFTAQSPDTLASTLLSAMIDILSRTSTFTAPVVPVTRTTSGNRIYMAFFKPIDGNFWEGNVTKFGLSDTNAIVDANDHAATWPNGAMKDDAVPYWQTKDWADYTKSNYIHNSYRNIYTYLGLDTDLTVSSNSFDSSNNYLTGTLLGNPTQTTTQIIDYVRGADVFDDDGDSDLTENREIITGDVLHSEPLIVHYDSSTSMVYFGSNDGMLHAVSDSDGTEAWAFIPPDQLHRLKQMVDGSGHQIFVDSSPRAYIKDVDGDGEIESADGDKVILVCGERGGGTSYFALDVTSPQAPVFLWRINRTDDAVSGSMELNAITGTFQDDEAISGGSGGAATVNGAPVGSILNFDALSSDFSVGAVITGASSGATATIVSITKHAPDGAPPDVVIPELGESWSEPRFGLVKTTDNDTTGTTVCFIGGGYSSNNAMGKVVLAVNVLTGAVVKQFVNNGTTVTDMNYSFPSTINVIDGDSNGFVDKVYVGDLGSQLWRFGKFTDSSNNPLVFPNCDENINNWTAQVLFLADSTHGRKFYYPPNVTLEKGYDLLFMGTGDREQSCSTTSAERIYAVKDMHGASTFGESDLVDVTDPAATAPNLDLTAQDVDNNSHVDQGWYIQLANGEKVLSEGTVFYKAFYVTTFTPNNEPCLPGGMGKLYALGYKTAGAVLSFGENSPTRSEEVGGGIPSKPVIAIRESMQKLFTSVGSSNPDTNSMSVAAGVKAIDPLGPPINFFYMWWKQLN